MDCEICLERHSKAEADCCLAGFYVGVIVTLGIYLFVSYFN